MISELKVEVEVEVEVLVVALVLVPQKGVAEWSLIASAGALDQSVYSEKKKVKKVLSIDSLKKK